MTTLPIDKIRRDGATQPRTIVNSNFVDEYAEDLKNGATFPPVDVFFDGETYWLVDGFHRLEARLVCGLDSIEANVHQGTMKDAQWFSFSVNRAHGARRTNYDKQRAVEAALKHPKSKWLSDREIARHVGVGHATVSRWREAICPKETDTKPTTRTATRNGKTYKINTENIGNRTAAPVADGSKGKRQQMREAAAKRRMIDGLSHVSGSCCGLSKADVSMILGACDDEETRVWAKTARNSAKQLAAFAARLEAAQMEGLPEPRSRKRRENFDKQMRRFLQDIWSSISGLSMTETEMSNFLIEHEREEKQWSKLHGFFEEIQPPHLRGHRLAGEDA